MYGHALRAVGAAVEAALVHSIEEEGGTPDGSQDVEEAGILAGEGQQAGTQRSQVWVQMDGSKRGLYPITNTHTTNKCTQQYNDIDWSSVFRPSPRIV